jgi:hypothetical protein
MSDSAWLVLAYTLPPEPSRMRVSVWRRLRKLGAVYMDEGVWVLPNTQALAGELRSVVRDIENFGGQAAAFVSADMEQPQAERLKARFVAARDEEYEELLGQCARFMVHIEHAVKTERFTFAEVEELEEEISKLERWLEEIQSRDLFRSAQAAVSTAELEKGREALTRFTERTYAVSGERQGGSQFPLAPEQIS